MVDNIKFLCVPAIVKIKFRFRRGLRLEQIDFPVKILCFSRMVYFLILLDYLPGAFEIFVNWGRQVRLKCRAVCDHFKSVDRKTLLSVFVLVEGFRSGVLGLTRAQCYFNWSLEFFCR